MLNIYIQLQNNRSYLTSRRLSPNPTHNEKLCLNKNNTQPFQNQTNQKKTSLKAHNNKKPTKKRQQQKKQTNKQKKEETKKTKNKSNKIIQLLTEVPEFETLDCSFTNVLQVPNTQPYLS